MVLASDGENIVVRKIRPVMKILHTCPAFYSRSILLILTESIFRLLHQFGSGSLSSEQRGESKPYPLQAFILLPLKLNFIEQTYPIAY